MSDAFNDPALCIALAVLVAVEYVVLVAEQLGWIDGMITWRTIFLTF